MKPTRPRVSGRAGFPTTGHTLVEVITVVLILSILAVVAVPRVNLGAVGGTQADATVRQIATDLRRARANAILHAAQNPHGFALVMTGGSPYDGYEILDLRDSRAIAVCTIPETVRCTGGPRFEFGPLGNLRTGSASSLRVAANRRTYLVEIVPATGAVRWAR